MVTYGWRRWLIAALSGSLLSLSLAPYFIFPVLFISLPILVFLLDGAVGPGDTKRGATTGSTWGMGRLSCFWPGFGVGWWFALGFFTSSFWWLGAALLVDADRFAWALPLATLALPSALALLWGFAAGLARCLWPKGPFRLLTLAAAFLGAEWLRSHILTGLPWNHLGLAAAPHPIGLQSASVIGLDGLAFLALMIGSAPVIWIDRRLRHPADASYGRWYVRGALVLLVLHVSFGVARLTLAQDSFYDDVRLRIVQPNIPQAQKWLPEKRSAHFNKLLELSDRVTSPEDPGLSAVTHLIWPETAFPFLLSQEPGALAALSALLPDETLLIAGAARAERAAPPGEERYFNSLYVLDSEAEIVAVYDKVHLVPFGEYLPFESLFDLAGLRQIIPFTGGFEAGPGYRTLSNLAATPPVLPLICYEILFAHEATHAANQASWIVNVTNDAWFGDTPGPRQHLHSAQLRAVLGGLSVVRAANTGISAVIDPYGRVRKTLHLGIAGTLNSELPKPLDTPPFVASLPNWTGGLLALTLLFVAYLRSARNR